MFPGLFVSGSPTPRISTSSTLLSLELWWKHYGCPSDFCGVYNDGKHVFVQDARSGHPGAFIDQPLSFFAFKERSIDVGDIWIAHFGHMFGLSGGNAIVRAPRICSFPRFISRTSSSCHKASSGARHGACPFHGCCCRSGKLLVRVLLDLCRRRK